MNSPGMLIAGIATLVGGGALGTGLIIAGLQRNSEGLQAPSLSLSGGIVAGASLLTGVPLIVAGAWAVPAHQDVVLVLDGAGATMKVSF